MMSSESEAPVTKEVPTTEASTTPVSSGGEELAVSEVKPEVPVSDEEKHTENKSEPVTSGTDSKVESPDASQPVAVTSNTDSKLENPDTSQTDKEETAAGTLDTSQNTPALNQLGSPPVDLAKCRKQTMATAWEYEHVRHNTELVIRDIRCGYL